MLSLANVATILLMALATYATRVAGYAALKNRQLSPRLLSVLECVPGCVLLSVIAPAFATGKVADSLALAVTLLCAWRLPILPTVVAGVASAGLLRQCIGF